jgi:hypothetical protein
VSNARGRISGDLVIRRTFARSLLFASIAVAACSNSDGNSSPDLASADAATARDLAASPDQAQPPDLAQPADLAQPPDMAQLGCAGELACIFMCTAVNRDACVGACMNLASAQAKTYFAPLQGCAQPACFTPDGGAGPCVDPSSQACHDCVQANCGNQLVACQSH